MNGRFETFDLVVGAPGSGLAVPGRIQRLLSATLGIQSEEIGTIVPLERGRVAVEIALTRSRRIGTPAILPFVERGRTSLWELRRSSDPKSEGTQTWLLTYEGKAVPTPGQVATALNHAFPEQVGAEELGLSFVGGNWIRLEVPERLAAFSEPPKTLTLGKTKVRVEVMH